MLTDTQDFGCLRSRQTVLHFVTNKIDFNPMEAFSK